MQVYLVGGAVRDKLLGIESKDKDYVVVGSSEKEMLSLGYQKVGVDFPVFLHPETGFEYALARRERKIAAGYHGFAIDASASVTLHEDLYRRDLTINAMAIDEHGMLIDPYNGFNDLKKRLLKHVSPAFAEDPVRILRTARFAARYKFSVHPQTIRFMKGIVGELLTVSKERIWKEFEKGLMELYPHKMISVLSDCGVIGPSNINQQVLAPFNSAYLYLDALRYTAKMNMGLAERLAIVTMEHSVALEDWSIPAKFVRQLKQLNASLPEFYERPPAHTKFSVAQPLTADPHALLAMYEKLGLFQNTANISFILNVLHALKKSKPFVFDEFSFTECYKAVMNVNAAEIAQDCKFDGKLIKHRLNEARLAQIMAWIKAAQF